MKRTKTPDSLSQITLGHNPNIDQFGRLKGTTRYVDYTEVMPSGLVIVYLKV